MFFYWLWYQNKYISKKWAGYWKLLNNVSIFPSSSCLLAYSGEGPWCCVDRTSWGNSGSGNKASRQSGLHLHIWMHGLSSNPATGDTKKRRWNHLGHFMVEKKVATKPTIYIMATIYPFLFSCHEERMVAFDMTFLAQYCQTLYPIPC